MTIEELLRTIDKNNPLPCHLQIAKVIMQAMDTGILRLGERLPSERVISSICGVSRPIVRLAFDTLVWSQHLQKIPGKGTFVNLRSGSGRHGIGCVLSPVSPQMKYAWPYIFSRAIVSEVVRSGYEAIVYLSDVAEELERMERDIKSGRIRGILAMGRVKRFIEGIPIVCGSRMVPGWAVDVDFYHLVYQAVALLKEQGRRQIALINAYGKGSDHWDDVIRGLLSAFSEYGLSLREGWVVDGTGGGAEDTGDRAVRQIYESEEHPDGIIFNDDFYALGGTRALVELGVRVPEEVMVVTHMNKGYLLPYPVPVLGVEVNPHKMAREMLAMLDLLMRGDVPSQRLVLVKPEIVESEVQVVQAHTILDGV
jgi:DNA-binding LacI/PurR family transcriptional regulator